MLKVNNKRTNQEELISQTTLSTLLLSFSILSLLICVWLALKVTGLTEAITQINRYGLYLDICDEQGLLSTLYIDKVSSKQEAEVLIQYYKSQYLTSTPADVRSYFLLRDFITSKVDTLTASQ